MRLWLGAVTEDLSGHAAGIGVLHAGAADAPSPHGSLAFVGTAVAASSPTWLAPHPTLEVLYAAHESEGTIRAYARIGPDALAARGHARAAGMETCHVAVSPDGRWLVASGYGDGSVARMRLDADGLPGEPEFGDPATDPYAAGASLAPGEGIDLRGAVEFDSAVASLRAAVGDAYAHLLPDTPAPSHLPDPADPGARRSHAHQARFLPGGLVATTDLGFDLVRFWREGRLVQEVALPFGSGPRHMVWHPSGHLYVLTEFSCEVFALAPDVTGVWRLVTAATVSREATVGADFPAELSMSADGAHLYAGIRGIDALAVLRVRGAGDRLETVATVEAHVEWPRHHVLVGDELFVAGTRSDEVVTLSVDHRTQIPGRRRDSAHAPSPTMILPSDD